MKPTRPLVWMLLLSGLSVFAQELPAGHPPLSGPPPSASGQLPAGHPPLQDSPKELPSGHPPANPTAAPPSLEELLKKLDASGDLKTRDKPFEIAMAVGKLYYAHGRFAEAAEYLGQASKKADPVRTFYLQQKKKAEGQGKAVPPPASVGCMPNPDQPMEALAEVGRQKATAGNAAAAAACARAALFTLREVEGLLGNALFVAGDFAGALAAYERQLEVFESAPDGRYGRAMLLVDTRGDDLKALKVAQADLERFLRDYPTSQQAKQAKVLKDWVDAAIPVGGVSKLVASRSGQRAASSRPTFAHPPMQEAPVAQGPTAPPALSKEVMEAYQNAERTPEMEAGFAKTLDAAEDFLAQGRFQEALDSYKQVMPFQPENGRVQAGMAWSLVSLNRQPMADRIWMVAVGNNPAAVDALGDTLKAKGDDKQAKALWSRLAQSAPGYASKLGRKRD